MAEKKVPIRSCIACRTPKPKKELVRIVKCGEEIKADFSGKLNGIGAYVCKDANCIAKLKKQKLLNRAFSCEVESSVYDVISEEILGKEN